MSTNFITVVFEGFLLGWAVAWPPGPINLEMFRRGISRGVFAAWIVGLGACTGDFFWALLMNTGATVLAQNPKVKLGFGLLSSALLLFIAYTLFKHWLAHRRENPQAENEALSPTSKNDRNGYLTGLGLSFTSPWNIAFWFAVAGQSVGMNSWHSTLVLASSVMLGALTWIAIMATSAGLGGRFLSRSLQKHAELVTAILMVAFSLQSLNRLFFHS